MGPRRATRFLQAAAGVKIDGVFGPLTLQAVTGMPSSQLVSSYCSYRETYYQAIVRDQPKLAKFLGGWLNRLSAIRQRLGVPPPHGQGGVSFGLPKHSAKIPDFGTDPAFDLTISEDANQSDR
jgi:hypothetical protein